MKAIIMLLTGLFFLTGCCPYERIGYGEESKFGRIYHPLCERSKWPIKDLPSMSFELPEPFKQVDCNRWRGYALHVKDKVLEINTPSEGQYMGEYIMYFKEGVRYLSREYTQNQAENLVSQEDFIKQKIQWNEVHKRQGKPIEVGFVDVWSGGRCARLLYGIGDFFDYSRRVEYYCWPNTTNGKWQVPFSIGAIHRVGLKKYGVYPPESIFTDLDNELIKPVLDSLEIYPLPD